MLRQSQIAACILAIASWATGAAAAPAREGLQFRDVQLGSVSYRFEVYVPPSWNQNDKLPVILFLHGVGHRGTYGPDDGFVLGKLFLEYQRVWNAIVVMPRCPKGAYWSTPEMEALALKALEQAIVEFGADRRRVYLTGLSMGGYGTWYFAARNPGKFAAIAPVCGGIKRLASVSLPAVSTAADPYADVAGRIGKTPVWIFHGAADAVIDVAESRAMANAIRAAGGNVRFTEYPGVGHNSWNQAYADSQLFEWMFQQRLP